MRDPFVLAIGSVFLVLVAIHAALGSIEVFTAASILASIYVMSTGIALTAGRLAAERETANLPDEGSKAWPSM